MSVVDVLRPRVTVMVGEGGNINVGRVQQQTRDGGKAERKERKKHNRIPEGPL